MLKVACFCFAMKQCYYLKNHNLNTVFPSAPKFGIEQEQMIFCICFKLSVDTISSFLVVSFCLQHPIFGMAYEMLNAARSTIHWCSLRPQYLVSDNVRVPAGVQGDIFKNFLIFVYQTA